MVVFYLHLLSLFLIFKVFVDLFLRFLHLLLDDLFALLQVGIGSLTAPNIEEVECLQIVVQSCRRVILQERLASAVELELVHVLRQLSLQACLRYLHFRWIGDSIDYKTYQGVCHYV